MVTGHQLAFINDPWWYKDAIIYQLHVKSFYDANGDGSGDFAGLIDKLDYIDALGVNAIWLLPFYVSPRRDDGYDIADYRAVHPAYGTMSDAKRFIEEAHRRGLRVISELVANHTSDQHAWFQRARHAPRGSAERNFYVWSDDDGKYADTRIIFPDFEQSNWTWDPVANQYYWHRFYAHQPDLNFDNPQVLEEVLAVMRFWFDLGVDGLRLDAVSYLVEREGTSSENLPETHRVLKQIRAALDRDYPDRVLLAEVNQWPEHTLPYFGGDDRGLGDECQMVFHFPLMPRMYMAVAQEDRFPITDILRQTPEIPANCQWAVFLRNHDELTLEMVTDEERDYLWSHYAADARARINLGIRRRLAPLMEGDRRRIELMHSLLISMPGTPILYYGDELGMGDNLYLGDRDGVRTPMQWSSDRNGGFSRADPANLTLPVIESPHYGFMTVNVDVQAEDSHSLLNWTRRMLAVRRQHRAFGRGGMKMLAPENHRILAYLRQHHDTDSGQTDILCVANMSRAAQAVELDLSAYADRVPVEMTGGSAFPPISRQPYQLTLPPYGFYWFLLADASQMPSWYEAPPQALPELTTLVVDGPLETVLEGDHGERLRRDILPAYLRRRRWFRATDQAANRAQLRFLARLEKPDFPIFLTEVRVPEERGERRYQLLLGIDGDSRSASLRCQQLALARVRSGRTVRYLTDASGIDRFSHTIVDLMRHRQCLAYGADTLHFSATDPTGWPEQPEVRHLPGEHTNTAVILGEALTLKIYRELHSGVHPEAEIVSHLRRLGFEHCPRLEGQAVSVDERGESSALMVLLDYVDNQGSAWEWTQATLDRAIRAQLAGGGSAQENQYSALAELEAFAGQLGRRLGEMHGLLAAGADEDFSVERYTAAQCRELGEAVTALLNDTLASLEPLTGSLSDSSRATLAKLQALGGSAMQAVRRLAAALEGGLCCRIHGDLHLGQVLVVKGDAYFIDFEGRNDVPLAQRRSRQSPYRDVSGLLAGMEQAAAQASREAQGSDTSAAADLVRVDIVLSYRERAEAAFLAAYRAAASGLIHHWRDGAEAAALTLFGMESTCRDIACARRHSQEVEVALHGLADAVDAAVAQA